MKAPTKKCQQRDQAHPKRTSEGERLREIREEMRIDNDFELLRFMYLPLQMMGWRSYFMDGTELIHREMVRFT